MVHPHPMGPYDLHDVLGRGGMGTVYLGIHQNTGARAAVKVLAPAYGGDPGFRERFDAEIRSLEKLRHPNIVELHGYGEEEGTLFYAMELVEGTNLQQELAQGRRFQWREVVRLGVEICQALKHAHDHGIIHRDIKPANLLLARDERLKLTDFGIAKLFGNTQITVDGGVLGTADFMSPEQAEGIGATSKSDLYCVGAVLYALLTGRPPFRGKSMAEVIHKVRYDHPPSLRHLASETPQELVEVVEKLLSKSPDDRVPTALALANRLAAIQHALTLRENVNDASVLHLTGVDDHERNAAEFAELETVAESESRAASAAGNPAAVKPSLRGSANTSESPRTHFTVVDEESRTRPMGLPAAEEESLFARVATIGLLVGLLGALAYIVWWFQQPPTADAMMARIDFAQQQGAEALTAQEPLMREFLERFPDEPRAESVRGTLEELEFIQLERQLEVTGRLRNASRVLAPIEHAVVDALRKEDLNPDTAARDFADIIAVFGSDEDATDRERRCIQLAKRHLQQLQSQIQRNSETYAEALAARVAFARGIVADRPDEARRILSGIVRLYGDKTWADDVVRSAQSALRDGDGQGQRQTETVPESSREVPEREEASGAPTATLPSPQNPHSLLGGLTR